VDKETLRNLVLSEILENPSDVSEVELPELEEVPRPADENPPPTSQELNADSRIQSLKTELLQCTKDGLRYQIVQQMILHEEQIRDKEARRKDDTFKRKQEFLKSRGVSLKDLQLLTRENMEQPYADPIALKLEEYDRLQEEKDRHHRAETAKQVFANKWIKDTELKLFDLVNQNANARNESTIAGIQGMIEILQHKLKVHHTKMGTWNMKEALQARRNFCKAQGILRQTDEHLIVSLACLLPVKESRAEQDSDEDSLFLTPRSSCSQSQNNQKRRSASQRSRAITKKKKSSTSTQQNTLDEFLKTK